MIDPPNRRVASVGIRRVRTPLALPSVRAVVGGLLVAASCVAVAVAHHSATRTRLDRWLVVRGTVDAGEVVRARDLALAPMDLPAMTRTALIADPADAVGRVTLVALHRGDPVERSALADGPARPGDRRRVGVAIDEAAALGGALTSGRRVDVVAVGDQTAPTEIVATDALVAAVSSPRAGLGADGRVRVVLDVADAEVARRIVDAAAHDGVSLIAPSPTPSPPASTPAPAPAQRSGR